jgi:hypothetical protein
LDGLKPAAYREHLEIFFCQFGVQHEAGAAVAGIGLAVVGLPAEYGVGDRLEDIAGTALPRSIAVVADAE